MSREASPTRAARRSGCSPHRRRPSRPGNRSRSYSRRATWSRSPGRSAPARPASWRGSRVAWGPLPACAARPFTLVNEYRGRLPLLFHARPLPRRRPDDAGARSRRRRSSAARSWSSGAKLPDRLRAEALEIRLAPRSDRRADARTRARPRAARDWRCSTTWSPELDPSAVSGLAIEAATEHVEVLVRRRRRRPLAHEVEEVGHGHTRRLAALVKQALERATRAPRARSNGSPPISVRARSRACASASPPREALALAAKARASTAPRRWRRWRSPRDSARADRAAGAGRPARSLRRLLPCRCARPRPRCSPRHASARPDDAARRRARGGGTRVPRGDRASSGRACRASASALERAYPGSTSAACASRGGSRRTISPPQSRRVAVPPPVCRDARRARARSTSALGASRGARPSRAVRALDADAMLRDFARERPAARRRDRARRVFTDPWPESFFRGGLRTPMLHARIAERRRRARGLPRWRGSTTGPAISVTSPWCPEPAGSGVAGRADR